MNREFSKAQLAFLDEHRDWNVDDSHWYEFTIDDFTEVAKNFGFDIHDVRFSGFSSQGDGASFVTNTSTSLKYILETGRETLVRGDYGQPSNFTGTVKAFYEIFQLIESKLAAASLSSDCLDIMDNSTIKLYRGGHSNYSHSNTMNIDYPDDGYDCGTSEETLERWIVSPEPFRKAITDVQHAMLSMARACADALYKELEAEYDHQTSNEAIWENMEANDAIPKHLQIETKVRKDIQAPKRLEDWITQMSPA